MCHACQSNVPYLISIGIGGALGNVPNGVKLHEELGHNTVVVTGSTQTCVEIGVRFGVGLHDFTGSGDEFITGDVIQAQTCAPSTRGENWIFVRSAADLAHRHLTHLIPYSRDI